ncbi:hypothetical protein M426DRAFT_317825 [Hypoxylon sp. CI-4A]|nr:hypothetical protein M426DRAFT_317825 [Hypoxylon sp. CI-4A]
MASFTGALLRLVFKRRPQEGRIDEEHGFPNASNGSATGHGPNILGGGPNVLHGHRSYRVTDDDPLALFRLMVGISTSQYLGYSESSPVGTRPAANIGIYTRVVHAEQKAKDRFKVFSIIINACYFLQIVVAASITAMGAAGVSHGAVTAFGAINTIIAGLLTFLKGSGLPARLKYYGNEWKKLREFIEQRERDFSRTGCTLDVYEVVATIDRMYSNTKQDIEMNTPDNYTSVTGNMLLRDGIEGTVGRMATGLENRAHNVSQRIQEHGRGIQEHVHGMGKAVIGEVEDHATSLDREAREHSAQVVRAVDEGQRGVIDSKDRIEQAGTQAVRDAGETHRTAMQRFADNLHPHDLGHHHDSKHEEEKS